MFFLLLFQYTSSKPPVGVQGCVEFFRDTEEFKKKLIDSGIEDPTEEDIGKYILKTIENLVD